MSALFSSESAVDGIPLSHTMPDSAGVSCSAAPQQEVGRKPLSDSEREAAIHAAGDLFLKYYAKWEATGDFQYRGDADRALQLQRLLILGRSPAAAARIAAEEGR